MHARSTGSSWLRVALAWLCIAADAQAEVPPLVSPQWTTSFEREVPAGDQLASRSGPTWFRSPDGSTVLVTASGDPLLRRFSADGVVEDTRRLPSWRAGISVPVSDVAIGADPGDGGIYLLISAGQDYQDCWLVRTTSRFELQWSIPAPGSSVYDDPCEGLHVLADGSALVLRNSTLARIDRSGQALWSRGLPEDGRFLGGQAFAVDAQDVIWVAGASTTHANSASVSRFKMSGERMSSDAFLCATCVASVAEAVDVLPNGDVIVGGRSGSSQPGFLVRYDSSGARRLWVDTEVNVRYSRIAHDENGAVYAMAETGWAGEIRRIDPASGVTQWAIPADDFAARTQGIVAVRAQASGLLAVGVDPAGNEAWSTPLSSRANATFSRPFARGDGAELLVWEPPPASTPCGSSPRLLALDAAGAIGDALQACTEPVSKRLVAIDALPDTGVLAHLDSELVAFHPSGDERWRALACATCAPGSSNDGWAAAALTADGGAWAVRTRSVPSGVEASLDRIGPDGRTVFAVPAAAGAWSNPEIRLFVEPGRVIALTGAMQRLVWQAVGADGSPLGTHVLSMPDPFFDIQGAHLNADGSLTVVAKGRTICNVGCNPYSLSLLRIAADGTLAWRHDIADRDWPASPMPDGGVLMALSGRTPDAPPQLQRFDPQGNAQAPVALAGIAPDARPMGLSGPIDGRWLLQTGSYGAMDTLWSLGESGDVGASRSDLRVSPYAVGDSGYLMPAITPMGVRMQLLDGVTLQARATLPYGTSGDPILDPAPWYWRVLGDGSVYGTWLSPLRRFGVARYALPWGAPQDWLFRNGFD